MAQDTCAHNFQHRLLSSQNCDCSDDRRYGSCPICDGGLALCTTCGGAEASLPKDCPGRRMTGGEQDAVQAGSLNFVSGNWVAR